MARPTKYTEDIANKLCAKLSMGESLRTACRDEEMPCVATVYNWFKSQPEFLEQYARAKEEAADAMIEDILDIADDGTNDWMERLSNDGETYGWQVNGEAIQRSRLRVEARKWVASKLKPKKYGDKIHQEVTGRDGGPILASWEVLPVAGNQTSSKDT